MKNALPTKTTLWVISSLRYTMKKIFASLTLAAFMLGGVTAFAYTPKHSASPTMSSKKKHNKRKHKHHSTAPASTQPKQ